MTELRRVRSVWSGFPGGPGVTTMYLLDTDTAVADLHILWAALAFALPVDVHIQVENIGDTIEDSTGALTGTWPASDAVSSVAGTNESGYAAPVGAVVDWLTSTVTGGSRLRGRSFLVPLAGNNFQTDGTLTTTSHDDIANACSNWADSQVSSFVVWRRPRIARAADGSRPAVTARAGSHGLVTGSRVPDMAAVLRSRRD